MARRRITTTAAAAVLIALALSISPPSAFAAGDEELAPPEATATAPTEAQPAPTPETVDPTPSPDDADPPAVEATPNAEGGGNATPAAEPSSDTSAPQFVDPSLAAAPSPDATAGAESPLIDDAAEPQVQPRPFEVPLARVYTGMPGAVIEVRGNLPALDAGAYAVTDAERGALDAECTGWTYRDDDPRFDEGCVAMLAHGITAVSPDISVESEVARFTAKRVEAASAIRDQLARNADSGIPASVVDGVLRLVADDDGFVALPQGVVEASVTLPFAGDDGDDPNAYWRTATFTLRPEVASLSGVDLVNAMFNATWSGWYTGGGGAGQGAFIEELANGHGTTRWIGQWGVGPQLAVSASLVPVVDPIEPEPEPVIPTLEPTPQPTGASPTPTPPASVATSAKALAETGDNPTAGLLAGAFGAAALGVGALLIAARRRLGGAR